VVKTMPFLLAMTGNGKFIPPNKKLVIWWGFFWISSQAEIPASDRSFQGE
jgi:hypothetical protein